MTLLFSHWYPWSGVVLDCIDFALFLTLYFSACGSFSNAKLELYKKGLKCYFKVCKNILKFHPSIKTSMHIYDHTIKPIFLYGSEIWGVLNPASSKYRNVISLNKILMVRRLNNFISISVNLFLEYIEKMQILQ